MRLFYLHTCENLLQHFLQDNYISIEIEWLKEDVEQVQWEELCQRYSQAAQSTDVRLFLHEMVDGDLIIMTDGQRTYIGDMGDYFYVEPNEQGLHRGVDAEARDGEGDGSFFCSHRRGVTWLKSIELAAFEQIRSKFNVNAQDSIAMLAEKITLDELEHMLAASSLQATDGNGQDEVFIDAATIREAVKVLQQALRSDDAERRERAAIALLTFAKR